ARAQRQKPAAVVERQFGLDGAAARLLVALDALAALGNPAYRAPGYLGRPERKGVFRVAAALHAKPAAHRVADDADLVVRPAQDLPGQRGADLVHRLDRAADRVAVLVRVVLREAAARLHRVGADPVDDDLV